MIFKLGIWFHFHLTKKISLHLRMMSPDAQLIPGINQSMKILAYILAHLWHLQCHLVFAYEQLPPGLCLYSVCWKLRLAHLHKTGVCPPEPRQKKSQLLWAYCACERAKPPSNHWTAKNEMPWLIQLKPFPQQMKADPSLSLYGCPA